MYYGNAKDAKAAGMFSRRHENPDALNRSRDLRAVDQDAKVHRAEIRQAARAELSDIQQLAKLLERPGNSLREMTRLFWRTIDARPQGGYSEAEKAILSAVAERIFPQGEYILAA